ncbi:hypothetical protein K353_04493 [Kitasatospora sp. SolWspMP-SS2h]|nr:hypothetical protein K353_04493 [Kitasatospora sp. SolWspMP-SS2h]
MWGGVRARFPRGGGEPVRNETRGVPKNVELHAEDSADGAESLRALHLG